MTATQTATRWHRGIRDVDGFVFDESEHLVCVVEGDLNLRKQRMEQIVCDHNGYVGMREALRDAIKQLERCGQGSCQAAINGLKAALAAEKI